MQRPPGPWIGRITVCGWLIVGYLSVLLHAFALARVLLRHADWITRLERRWIDLWMR